MSIYQEDFNAWANGYFAQQTNRLNRYIPKVNLLKDFNIATGFSFGMLRFTGYLKEWAQRNGYVYNPSDLTDHHGRITRTLNEGADEAQPMTVEMVYIRTHPQDNTAEIAFLNKSQFMGVTEEKDGLTLRDQFAMAALPAIIEKYGKVPPIATWAYEVANYMLAARKQEGGQA